MIQINFSNFIKIFLFHFICKKCTSKNFRTEGAHPPLFSTFFGFPSLILTIRSYPENFITSRKCWVTPSINTVASRVLLLWSFQMIRGNVWKNFMGWYKYIRRKMETRKKQNCCSKASYYFIFKTDLFVNPPPDNGVKRRHVTVGQIWRVTFFLNLFFVDGSKC